MGSIISVANQKGGVTKTTSTFNLAAALALKEKKVLMADLDAQASLTLSAGYDPLDFDKTICDVIENDSEIENAIYKTDIAGLSLLPSMPNLSNAELKMINMRNREKRLQKALYRIKNMFDYILLDCPPQISLITLNAFTASNYVIVPCETSKLSFYGLNSLYESIEGVKEDLNDKIEVFGVIATLFDGRTNDDKLILSEIKENYNLLGIVKRSVAAKKGLCAGLPTVIKEPGSPIAAAYIDIADKILNL